MSSAIDMEDLPLPALFRRAEATIKILNNSPPNPQESTKLVNNALESLQRAAALVDSLTLFSPNEDAEDLATGDLPYLFIPHYHAELLSNLHQGDSSSGRLGSLHTAVGLHSSFLSRIRQYNLFSRAAERNLAPVLEEDGTVADPASLRQQKIERFKLEKGLTARLEAVERQWRRNSKSGSGGEQEQVDEPIDEAVERELNMLRLELAAFKSAEALASLRKEIEVLEHAANLPEEEKQAQRSAPPPTELLAELRAAASTLGGDASRRERLCKEVFRPSHILPTISIEQQGEIEVAQMMEMQREEEVRERAAALMRESKRSSDEDDEEIYRQRAMDDFKDDNPRGWGNSKMRPCG